MLAGAYNFRDLGGLRTRDGRRLRAGRAFRSDTLQALTRDDVQRLYGDLGLRGVVDLRLADEVQQEGRGPLAAMSDVRYVNLPLPMAATAGLPPEAVMPALYLACLAPGSALARAVDRLCELSDQPVLFHCAAGKDRTGVLAAVLLRLLDVPDEAIVADYLRSADAMPRMIERFRTWPRYREHMTHTPPAAYAVEVAPLQAFLAALDAQPGGASGWLQREGVPEARWRLLCERWIE